MGVRAGASLYDSVTGITFGPVFETINEADSFLDWYNERDDTDDIRELRPGQIASWVEVWNEETGMAAEVIPAGRLIDPATWLPY
jgi:hypothetical protein